jgi:hypothetical protein
LELITKEGERTGRRENKSKKRKRRKAGVAGA